MDDMLRIREYAHTGTQTHTHTQTFHISRKGNIKLPHKKGSRYIDYYLIVLHLQRFCIQMAGVCVTARFHVPPTYEYKQNIISVPKTKVLAYSNIFRTSSKKQKHAV